MDLADGLARAVRDAVRFQRRREVGEPVPVTIHRERARRAARRGRRAVRARVREEVEHRQVGRVPSQPQALGALVEEEARRQLLLPQLDAERRPVLEDLERAGDAGPADQFWRGLAAPRPVDARHDLVDG